MECNPLATITSRTQGAREMTALISLSAMLIILGMSMASYKPLSAWYKAQPDRLKTLLFVLGTFILITVLMHFGEGI